MESFGQLDIPFKPKRKSSAPVLPLLDAEAIAQLKLQYNNIKEVSWEKVRRKLGPWVSSIYYFIGSLLYVTQPNIIIINLAIPTTDKTTSIGCSN